MRLSCKITEDGFGRAIITATDGKITGEIRGLRGKRVRQLLSKLKLTTSPDSEGFMIPIAVLRDLGIEGDFSVIKKGQTYKYTPEQIAAFEEQGLKGDEAIQGRKADGTVEPVVAGVEYISSEDGFRATDIRGINLELSDKVEGWLIDGKFKYVKPSKNNSSLADLAAAMEIGRE